VQLETVMQKIVSRQELQPILARWRFKAHTVVFTNGVFDLLHLGHLQYLAQAADLGHKLVIGLNSDASVKRIKGPTRPVHNQQTRALVLAALQFVDLVAIFDDDTPYELIKLVQPQILVKGADYQPEQIVGYDIVTAAGGRVCTIGLSPGQSTTATIGRMLQNP
jgi:rfaE bifunctional protein nucleotidyltransferase chain/domain